VLEHDDFTSVLSSWVGNKLARILILTISLVGPKLQRRGKDDQKCLALLVRQCLSPTVFNTMDPIIAGADVIEIEEATAMVAVREGQHDQDALGSRISTRAQDQARPDERHGDDDQKQARDYG
jgi:hypothetical protein